MYKELDKLVNKAKGGDVASKEEILNRLKGLVIKSIQRYYNKREEYDDLIQEGYLVILESIDNYDEERGVYFLGYIKTMLKYTYLNKHQERQHLSLNVKVGDAEDNELVDLLEADDEDPMNLILRNEDVAQVRYALSMLTDRQREVVVAFYFEEIPIAQIAKRLGITYRTVVNTKTKALEKMRQILLR
ncbi:MAG: sigma-70 family RNA polymerase sigma factor [Tissierellaceae bacterium]|jgi:RNA polymerase sporulation-specific sigma factor